MKKSLSIILLIQFFSSSAFCQNLDDLGTLGGANSEARAISADGTVIVGRSGVTGSSSELTSLTGGFYKAFVVNENGIMAETSPFGGNYSAANGVSGDGTLVVGAAYVNSSNQNYHAFLYNRLSGTITNLGVLARKRDGSVSSGDSSTAIAISADGNVIVGRADTSNAHDPISEAFKYVDGIMTSLGSITSGQKSQARAVSANGEIIVGAADIISSTESKAFKYVNSSDTMFDLGNLGGSFSDAYGVSANGSIIVGESINSSGNMNAFKYSDTTGMTSLGTLGGLTSSARGISGDGRIIVGQSAVAENYQHGFVFYDGKMIDIGTLGGNNSYINAIASNGKIFTGKSDISTSSGDFHAFIGTINNFNINLVDIVNTASAIAADSGKLNSVLNQKNNILNLILDQDAKLFGKNNLHVSIGTRYANVTPNFVQSYAGTLKVAYLFNKNFRAGIYIDQTIDSNLSGNFTMQNTHPAIALFATLSENQNNEGFKLRLSVAHDSNNLNIKRSVLANTEAAEGTSRLSAKGMMAELSYGFNLNDVFKIEPFTAIRHTKINRNNYTESHQSADLPITYQDMVKQAKTLLFGSRFAMQISKEISLRAQLAFEHDTTNSIDSYNGYTAYLGQFNISTIKLRKNRIGAGLGLTYSINKTQEIGFDLFYNQQSLNNNKSTTAYLYYSIGL